MEIALQHVGAGARAVLGERDVDFLLRGCCVVAQQRRLGELTVILRDFLVVRLLG